MTDFYYIVLLIIVVAFVITLATVPLASKIAWRAGSVDYPGRRRVNTTPTPRMGGIAVMLGIAMGFAAWALLANPLELSMPADAMSVNGISIVGLAVAVIAMFLVGVVDDVIQLTALNKFFWQIVAASLAVASGLLLEALRIPLRESWSISAGLRIR